MRLIDADELKKEWGKIQTLATIIDNAPTVETFTEDQVNELKERGKIQTLATIIDNAPTVETFTEDQVNELKE